MGCNKKIKIGFRFQVSCLMLYALGFAFLFGVVSVLPIAAQAAELKLSSPVSEAEAGRQLQVDLFLNTGEEDINALEGIIVFPQELLKLKEIRDGNTIVNLWLEKPKNDSIGGIAFSGITPGGFKGENGLIFSAIFETIKSGAAALEISEARALLNDGQGTPATLNILPIDITISEATSSSKPVVIEISDIAPPESFKPEIAQDQNVFDGKYFLVFATQDKGAGIEKYAVRESRQKFSSFLLRWQEAISPHLLADQELKSYIFVKAVDLAGNERIEVIPPKYPVLWYENYLFYAIITLSLIALLVLWKILRKKKGLFHQ